ncbi:MAG: hypothetical protein HYX41_03405 [Bdellovibrio sp.]|nr:hypothetical protein [Bdellovibrio sp.]
MRLYYLLVFVLGGILGTAGDFSHVASQTDGYANPLYPLPTGQPFWVPLLFGSASLGICISHLLGDRFLKRPENLLAESWPSAVSGVLVFLGLYVTSGFLPLPTGGAKDLVLWIISLVFWLLADRTWQGALLAVGTAVVGTCVEIGLTQSGAFFYTQNESGFFGVPPWLPSLYIAASVAVGNLARTLERTFSVPK